MDSNRVMNLSVVFSTLILFFLVGFGSCDFNQDSAECAEKMIDLNTCRPYIGGQVKAPPADCYIALKEAIDKNRRCLCIIVKDRDDPNAGVKYNLTLVLELPSTCHTPMNTSECVDLLHLAPNSPDAKVFDEFANGSGNNSTTPVPSSAGSGTGNGAVKDTGSQKSRAGWGKRWLVPELLRWILHFVFISQFFFIIL